MLDNYPRPRADREATKNNCPCVRVANSMTAALTKIFQMCESRDGRHSAN